MNRVAITLSLAAAFAAGCSVEGKVKPGDLVVTPKGTAHGGTKLCELR